MVHEEYLSSNIDLEGGGKSLLEFKKLSTSDMRQGEVEDGLQDTEGEEDSHSSEEATATQPAVQNYHGVLQITVPNEHRRYYEKIWMAKIYAKLSTFRGFRNRYVEVGASNGDSTEYVIVLIFDTFEHFEAWEMSKERNDCVQMLSRKQIFRTLVNAYGGLSSSSGAESGVEGGAHSLAQTTFQKISLHSCTKEVPTALPPPKWKLAVIITGAVYSALLIVGLSGTFEALLAADIPLGLALFLSICHTVIFLSYAGLPLIMSIPVVDTWLRRKRRCKPSQMHPLHAVLDQGLQIFSLRQRAPGVPSDVLRTIDKLEERVDKLLGMNKDLQTQMAALIPPSGNHSEGGAGAYDGSKSKQEQEQEYSKGFLDDIYVNDVVKMVGSIEESQSSGVSTSGRASPLTMAVRHYVKWEHQMDFEKWSVDMDAEMKKFKGYEGMVTIAPKRDGDPYINSFTFSTFEDLMVFSQSTNRKNLLCKLNHMLEATSDYQVAAERSFSDAFTELCVPTGAKAQTRPPPLWKSTILTIIPLHIVVWQGGSNISPYITRQVTLNSYLLLFLLTCFNVFVNTYVALPLMLSQFGDWLNMPRPLVRAAEKPMIMPPLGPFRISFKFLDVGLSFRWKILFVVVYVVVNIMFGFLL